MSSRAQFEGELVVRCGGWLVLGGLSKTPGTDAPPRAYLNPALRAGLQAVGLVAADPFGVSDADVGQVSSADVNRFMDHAQYTAVESAYHYFNAFGSKTLGSASISRGDAATGMEAELRRLWDRIVQLYGLGPQHLVSGQIPVPGTIPRPPGPNYPTEWANWPTNPRPSWIP